MEYYIENNDLKIKISSLVVSTVQDFFDAYIPSKKMQHLLIQNKWISIDYENVKRETAVQGKYLIINIYPYEHHYYHSSHKKLDIVYEDELFLIVNKPSGIIVHSDGQGDDNLSSIVATYYHDNNQLFYEANPIHRLDKNTSGLVMYSKSIVFQALLDQMLEKKMIRRTYLAYVFGKINKNTSFEIDKAIGKDRHNANKMVINPKGQKAITKVNSLGFSDKGYSILNCRLLTGRTHQIRVHLSSEGYPILNDDLYGRTSSLMKDMGLLAYKLAFFHPLKEEVTEVELELKGDFKRLYEEVVDD